eukprot:SAG31_NODE_5425_length_2546_cov_2.299550_1_plen_160_part_00
MSCVCRAAGHWHTTLPRSVSQTVRSSISDVPAGCCSAERSAIESCPPVWLPWLRLGRARSPRRQQRERNGRTECCQRRPSETLCHPYCEHSYPPEKQLTGTLHLSSAPSMQLVIPGVLVQQSGLETEISNLASPCSLLLLQLARVQRFQLVVSDAPTAA